MCRQMEHTFENDFAILTISPGSSSSIFLLPYLGLIMPILAAFLFLFEKSSLILFTVSIVTVLIGLILIIADSTFGRGSNDCFPTLNNFSISKQWAASTDMARYF